MKCIRCGRAINAAAVSIPATKGRPMVFGPKCARRAGLIETKQRGPQIFTRTKAEAADPRQMPLELAA